MIQAAFYLVLIFPGTPHPVVTLPMANATICEQERVSAVGAYYKTAGNGSYKVFAYCANTGFPERKNSN